MFNKSKLLLFCILFIGLFFRLYGNNWDQGWHLHPDERFLTMVGVDVKIPPTISHYLDQTTSTFNPVNRKHEFYVYGTFPVLLNKVIAERLNNDSYDQFNLQGRALSGIADFFIIFIVYKLLELVEKKLKLAQSVKYLGAFFYAISVLPIQLSHFFTVDTFLNFFCWLSFYYSVRLNVLKLKYINVLIAVSLSGVFLGLAIACKISAIYFAPLVGIFVVIGLIRAIPVKTGIQSKISFLKLKMSVWIPASAGMTIFVLSCYLALRFGAPYYFETNNVINPQLSKVFMNNIATLRSFENPIGYFPPAIQWFSKSYDFPIRNVIFFGIGPFYFLFSLWGAFVITKKRNSYVLLSIMWLILFLLYQSFQFAKTMRYLIFIYPFLAMFAAVGVINILSGLKKLNKITYYLIYIFSFVLVIIWPLAFMSIYTKDQSRVAASEWIYENIPSKSVILTEYWDDPLPLMVQDPGTRNYIGKEVHIFDPDSQEKWKDVNTLLSQGDYYIMSSNRAWGSIMDIPEKYPTTSQWYKSMMKNEKGYTLEKEFYSYPSLRYLGIPIDFPDQWAEEAFTVYDHPLVKIYKRTKSF